MEDADFRAFERLQAISDGEWRSILLELEKRAESIVGKKYWSTPDGTLPKGFESHELAQQAITLLLDPESDRHWDPDKEPDVLKALVGIVRSLASNLVKSADHKQVHRPGFVEKHPEVSATASPSRTPLEDLERVEEIEAARRLRDWCWEHLKGEEEQVVFIGLEGGLTLTEIAEQAEMDIERVYQVVRNMKRRLTRARQVLEPIE